MSGPIPIKIADPLKTAWWATNDLGNAKRVEALADGRLLWVDEMQRWVMYDGRRWAAEGGDLAAQRMAHRVIEHVQAEADALSEILEEDVAGTLQLKTRVGAWCTREIAEKRVETLLAHAVKSGNAGMTAGMLKQARSLLAASVEDFDLDPLAYNVANGTLRFFALPEVDPSTSSGQASGRGWAVRLDAHEPTDRLMRIADVAHDADARAPFWESRLAMLTPDAEQLAALRPLYGYTLTGLTSDQAFYVHQGRGGDGKSVTHMGLAALHGDYYRHANIATFLQSSGQKSGAEHRSDLVRLRGDVRFVTSDEPPPKAVWDGSTIKQITGSFVTARGSNATTEVTFPPRFKAHIECNVTPRAPSDDKGFRRRMKLYQWKVSLDELPEGAMPIDQVLARIADERPGVLNWLIDGALEWLTTRHIPQPAAMADVLADFWADSSPLLEWMGEWCDTSDPAALTPFGALYTHFKNWCEERGLETVMSKTLFGSKLRDRQFANFKDAAGNRWRRGIALRSSGLFGGPSGNGVAPASPTPQRAGSFGADAGQRADPPFDADDLDDLP